MPAGRRYWWGSGNTNNITLGSRTLQINATFADNSYLATYTVASSDSVVLGDLGYDITNESSIADTAGNPLATIAPATISNYLIDSTVPTVSSAVLPSGTTLTITFSEKVWGVVDADNFTITGGGAPTVNSVTGLATSPGTADTSFDLALSATPTDTITLAYAQDSEATKRVRDITGNVLAAFSSQSVTNAAVLVSAISGGYLNAAESASSLTISGTSAGVGTGTTVTVTLDDSDADNTADITKTGTTNSSGAWSVTLTVADIATLEEGTVTVTGSATGTGSGTQSFVYDTRVPTISIAVVEGDGYVNSTEDDGGITISGTTVGADSGSDVDIAVSRGIQTASIADVAVSSNAWTTPLSLLNLTTLGEGIISITATVDDAAGNTSTATASFVYDATAPTTTVTGTPAGSSNVVALDTLVSGATVTHYKHKVVAGSSCTTGGYGSEVAVGTRITDSISSLSDGAVVLCVIGRDVAGNWQSESSATSASWTKDTTPPTNSAGAMTVNDANSTLTVNTKKALTITGTTDTTATVAGDYVALLSGTRKLVQSSVFADDSGRCSGMEHSDQCRHSWQRNPLLDSGLL